MAKLSKRTLRLSTVGLYLASLLVALAFQHGVRILEFSGVNLKSWPVAKLIDANFWYHRVTTYGTREPRAERVTVVTLSPKNDPAGVIYNVCAQRRYTAKLLRILETADPAAVVLDKWYRPGVCDGTDEESTGTGELEAAVSNLTRYAPVIIGRSTLSSYELADSMEAEDVHLRAILKSTGQVLEENHQFRHVQRPDRLSEGLIRLDIDTRRIPLGWPTFDHKGEVGTREPSIKETLAAATVWAVDREAFDFQGLQTFRSTMYSPFGTFIEQERFPTLSAIELICPDNPTKDAQWLSCQEDPLPEDFVRLIRHRIVLFGEINDKDEWQTVVGKMPGVFLHANYVEALLDRRILHPFDDLSEISITIAWFIMIEIVFQISRKPWKAALVAIGMSAVLALFFYYVLVVNLNYYAVLWPPGAIAILAKYLGAQFMPKGEEKRG